MKTKSIAAIVGIVALGAAAAGAVAHDRGGPGGRFDPENAAEHVAERIDDRLDLSDEQEEQVEKVLAERMGTMRESLSGALDSATGKFASSDFDAEDAEAIIASMESMRAQMRTHMAAAMADVHGILTPEQRQEAMSMISERGHGWLGGGHGRGGSREGRRGHRHGWFD